MEVASIILSLLAFLGSIFTYFNHDIKIKKQEKRLNDYQLSKYELEDVENQKAQIKGNLIKTAVATRSLIVFNAGKSIGYNIRLELLSELEGIIDFEFKPFEMLNPQEKTETRFFLASGHAETIKVKYVWDDSFKKNNEFIQRITI